MEALVTAGQGTYIDATFGRGGHSAALLARLGAGATLVALDRDRDAIESGARRFADEPRLRLVRGAFADVEQLCRQRPGTVHGILADLGVSSPQLDCAGRGFGIARDGPLDMRMDCDSGQSAADWLAAAGQDEIARVLWEYGEERRARRIAQAIVGERQRAPIRRTAQLAQLVQSVLGRPLGRAGRIHPATRTFMAIRIHINDELEQLRALLAAAARLLAAGGRLVVISFHSLEDRLVKHFFRNLACGPQMPRRLPVRGADGVAPWRLCGGLVRPADAECRANPRARSARLRAIERVAL